METGLFYFFMYEKRTLKLIINDHIIVNIKDFLVKVIYIYSSTDRLLLNIMDLSILFSFQSIRSPDDLSENLVSGFKFSKEILHIRHTVTGSMNY